MKKLLLPILALAMTLSLTACSGEYTTPEMVDVKTEQGISLKLPSDITLQENKTYINTETGDSAVFAVSEIGESPLSGWTKENVLAMYQSKYKDVVVKSFENGKQINGKESLVANVALTTPKGNAITIVLVMVTDGKKNYIVNLTYGSDNTDSSLAKNLQSCIDSITIKPTTGDTSIKDDFKEYVNNNANATFIPENNEIVKTYSDAIASQNEEILVPTLSKTLPTKNNALLEKMKAYKPSSTEIQELHNIYIKAVELRKVGYALMLEALTTKVSDESATNTAIAKLGESDAKFTEYETKRNSMMKDFGLVDTSKK